jgi:hypothetical protein
MFIPDPDFYPFFVSVPDPATAKKEERGKVCFPTFFVATNVKKI